MSISHRKIFDLRDTTTEPTDAQLAQLIHLVGDDIRSETVRLASTSVHVVAERPKAYGTSRPASNVAETQPGLVVIAGPNGSGKTTITRRIVQHTWGHDALYLNPDDLAVRDLGGWSPETFQRALLKATQIRADCLISKQSLIYETVLSAPGDLAYLEQAHAAGFFIRLLFICTDDPAINIRRVARRVSTGGHPVPTEKILSRYAQSLSHCGPALKTVDRAYLYDNSVDNADPVLLFRTENGLFKKIFSEPLNPWAQSLFDQLSNS